jgi:murein DD-endopeptidase MepM/ murein hydrolase activator NlpD
MKNINNTQDNTAVVEDGTLLSNNGSLGPANDLEKYASSAKINVYIVKEGDTLESIAKKFKISKDTIFYSNADLEDKDTLKIGQTLVILPVKDDMPKPVIKKEDEKTDVSSSEQIQTNTNKPADEVDQLQAPAPAPVPAPAPTVDTTTNVTPAAEPATPTGQPTGTVVGGYIWPFPEGVGRISQGLHADQAYDFAAPKGTPIYAVQSGIVLIAHSTGYNGGYGLYVVINFNDGRQAIFGHMSKVAAKAGDIVKQGDIIGYVGSTGHSTGPHVHIGFHGTLGNPYVGLKINSTDLMIND